MDAPAPLLVSAAGLTRIFRRGHRVVEALREVDLEVERGEFVVVMGPSGGGKSTLLNLIGGLDRPDSGTLEVAGVDVGRASQRELDDYRRRHVGFVFQFFNLISTVNAGDNVALALLARRTPWREARRLAGGLLAEFGLGDRVDHLPAELSGGEQQRVAIARAVAGEPDLVLADEPTGDVDAATTVTVMALLSRLNRERGMTVIAVTHDPALLPYASRVLILRDGSFL
ncbi:MAG: ABC transporter ATP-binding protein [Actinomycetota bacterium]